MIRKGNRYSRPKKPYEKTRIEEENVLVKKYGLKNKKEIWKALAKINYYRGRAKELAKKDVAEQEVLFNKLKAIGLKVDSIADVLGLKVENLLDRRLPTVVAKKKIANTVRQARQMVVHKNVLVDGKVVNIPSYIVPVALESSIVKRVRNKKPKVEAKPAEEVKEEVPAEVPKEETKEEAQ